MPAAEASSRPNALPSGREHGGTVSTVLGDVPLTELGRTDYHEHLFQISPLLPGDELDDESASGTEAASLAGSGFATMIDSTPIGLGRRPAAVARISAATGLRIVATTGAHREPHYGGDHWILRLSEQALADRFCAEVTDGLPVADGPGSGVLASGPTGEPVRAGVVKAGVGYWSISTFEHRVLVAAAACHDRTGVAVMVHLEHGSAAFEVLELLARHAVAPSAVALAHVDRNLDPGLHCRAGRGGGLPRLRRLRPHPALARRGDHRLPAFSRRARRRRPNPARR